LFIGTLDRQGKAEESFQDVFTELFLVGSRFIIRIPISYDIFRFSGFDSERERSGAAEFVIPA